MKLLFNENPSPRLVASFSSEFPGSAHIESLGLRGAADEVIWDFAGRQDYAIVSKDNDFRQLSFLYGAPPKVIWLSVGDAGTASVMAFISERLEEIQAFEKDGEATLLVLALR